MSIDTNSVTIIGRLTRDPELTNTHGGIALCRFSIAVNEGGKDDKKAVSFFDCTAWRKTAQVCGQYLHKGSQVVVCGRLHQSRFVDKSGANRSHVEITVNAVQFIGGKPDGAQATTPTSGTAHEPIVEHADGLEISDEFIENPNEDENPF